MAGGWPGNNAFRFEQGGYGFTTAVGDGVTGHLGGGAYITGTGADQLVPGSKYQVVLTWDATNKLVGYLNGVRKFTVSSFAYMPAAFSDVRIGIGFDATRRWTGGIDEVAMYGPALTPSQVSTHYAAAEGFAPPFTTGNFPNRALALSPIAYWRLQDSSQGPVTPGSLIAEKLVGQRRHV